MAKDKGGFGKPPKAFQFKKGTSGNPKGRPKKKYIDAKTQLAKILDSNLTTANGKKVTCTVALLQSIVKHAIDGKAHALKTLMHLTHDFNLHFAPNHATYIKSLPLNELEAVLKNMEGKMAEWAAEQKTKSDSEE
jgi:hypothetical protein